MELWHETQGPASSFGAVSNAALASCLCISQHGETSRAAPEGCPLLARWTPMICVALLG